MTPPVEKTTNVHHLEPIVSTPHETQSCTHVSKPEKQNINDTRLAGGFEHLQLEQLYASKLLTFPARRSTLAEECRLIKRPLLANIDRKGADIADNANLIMVTSALPNEGKTFTAINLAMSIAAERDRTVLLVDGDVARPSVASRLNIQNRAGFIDLLEGTYETVADVLVHTNIHNFRLITAGRLHEGANELLASERMTTVVDELSSRYHDRVIIFDSPPLLVTTESAVLASKMGQIMLVVAAEQTPQYAVVDAISRLGENQIIGLILNKYRPGLGNRYYGTNYGYKDHRLMGDVEKSPLIEKE
ncbi:AAA family ATPase [Rhodoferax sp. 4810]|uniref:non-specific protein-tyrosine kinase n=1 Tax=Thiospirillum jenense TaxID=1653858 RepID=A0A839HLI7_9GAMM|nr:XrtA-associated tyrosine autokinase [Thiospirillum jenense]MBB1077085.1 AAA family ATPase [Rhodoferax jenense]MBB1127179.1 AAA family ATPase [Thiospirillum jenense]